MTANKDSSNHRARLKEFRAKLKKFRAPKNDVTIVTPDSAPKASNLTDVQKLQNGRLLAALMLQASEASGTGLSDIQFNFCLQGADGKPLLSPASKESIRDCVLHYLADANTPPDIRNSLDKIFGSIVGNLPHDANQLHDYGKTLSLRADSFYAAARLIIDNAAATSDANNETTLLDLKKLNNIFQRELNKVGSPEKKQACYDAYMQTLTTKLSEATGMDEKDVTKNLKEAETIVNIQQRKTQITISGRGENIHLQIDQPLNRFSDFSKKQQEEWKDVYSRYTLSGDQATLPKWFQKRTDIEKKIWLAKMEKVVLHGEDVNMGPVVKKQGFPGLRNLALSSFATVKVDNNGNAEITSVSAKSVRSSNLVSQSKDGNRTLNQNQKDLTQQNIEQVSEIYQNNNMGNNAGGFSYGDTNRKPFVLCQTLVRKIGGGDDHVIKHKNAAIHKVNKRNGDNKIFGSNHCIGTPAKVSKAFHLAMHLAGANTIGMDHITAPVKDFMENAVINSVDNHLHKQYLRDLSDAALKGKHQGNTQTAKVSEQCGLSHEQTKTLSCIMQATNMYAKENGKKYPFRKTHQLHMASLEEIIYQSTGNCVQSSCKSGKDREGVHKNYRNAMLAFFEKNGRFPPSTAGKNASPQNKADRAEFVKLFVELFKTHHQARLAELNAAGCQGQKALSNILPKDIIKELKKDPEGQELLKAHKRNSALNDIGHSAVQADPAEVERVKERLANVGLPEIALNSSYRAG